ncbi:GTPase HflX, partial [Gardnerella vaginalis]
AGKSSIINRLTGSKELVENALFATLDTAVRKSLTKDGRAYTLVDTVGFVRRLPTQLVEAFKSTLEEVGNADVILHVVDGSHPDPVSQIEAVNEVLAQIDGVEDIAQIIAFNKSDVMQEPMRLRLQSLYPDSLIVSAASGTNIDRLRTRIENLLPSPHVHVK